MSNPQYILVDHFYRTFNRMAYLSPKNQLLLINFKADFNGEESRQRKINTKLN